MYLSRRQLKLDLSKQGLPNELSIQLLHRRSIGIFAPVTRSFIALTNKRSDDAITVARKNTGHTAELLWARSWLRRSVKPIISELPPVTIRLA